MIELLNGLYPEGDGGGAEIKNQDITITENGTYTAESGYTGIGTATVNVPQPTGEINITANSIVDVTNYATANVNVPTGSSQKYGATINNFLGDVAQDGSLEEAVGNLNIVFSGVTTLNNTALTGKFMCDTTRHIGNTQLVKSVSFPDLKTITSQNALDQTFKNQQLLESVSFPELEETAYTQWAFSYCFQGCSALKTVNFPKLKQAYSQQCFYYAFENCTSLNNISFPLLEECGSKSFSNAFRGCTNLSQVDFSSLSTISPRGFEQTFVNCTNLSSISFPLLRANFGSYTNCFNEMLYGVTGCTVHFPSNLQSVIGSWSDVQNGFGGTNTTVLFDLPETE